MNGLPYYKAYPRDFMEGTIGMPFDLKGAYRLVLDLIYMQGGRLPDDAAYISGHLGCSRKAWSSFRARLLEMGKLHLDGTHLTNIRATSELKTLANLSDSQRNKRLGKRKIKDLEEPQLNHTEPEPEPEVRESATHSPVRAKPAPVAGRFDEFWDLYPRKTAKKPAREMYRRAVARGASEQAIIDGAARYARTDKVARGYACNPDTWLNQERWTDEAEPAVNGNHHGGQINGKGSRWDLAMRLAEVGDGAVDDPRRPLLPARH